MQLTLNEIIATTGSALLKGNPGLSITCISTDSRTLKAGDVYLALKGERFNGHHFCEEALKKGALGLIVSESVEPDGAGFILQVANTESALGDIAHCWRQKFQIPVIGLTGSSGKTTTKDMLASILSVKGSVCKTKGNLNNLIGLPQTMMTLDSSHHYAVWEMGMNHFGEIDRLAEIASPDIGLITNVGHAHLEGVGGSIEGVAKAKGELFNRLGSKAIAIVNADDSHIVNLPTQAAKVFYGTGVDAEVRLLKTEYDGDNTQVLIEYKKISTSYKLPFVGEYLFKNFLAAATVALSLGLSPQEIQQGIMLFTTGKMRGEELKLKNGTIVVVDCYNANPDSTKAALKAIHDKFSSRKKVAVLGSMLELGKDSAALHVEVGSFVATSQFDSLYAFGPEAELLIKGFSQRSASSFEAIDKLSQKLLENLTGDEVVLIKGSRGMQMERVAEFLKTHIGV